MSKSRIHLNRKGISSLARNFRDTISSYLWDVSSTGIGKGNDLDYKTRELNILEILSSNRLSNSKKAIFSCININSIRNKFGNLSQMMNVSVSVFADAGTKIDKSFPPVQVLLNGFHKPYLMSIVKVVLFWFMLDLVFHHANSEALRFLLTFRLCWFFLFHL